MKFLIHNSKFTRTPVSSGSVGFNILRVNPRRGFTLIETFVAITVLVFAVAGPLTLVSQSLFASLRAKDQLIATYLSEGALENIRNIRDENIINDREHDEGFNGTQGAQGDPNCYSPNICSIDISAGTIASCGATCSALDFNTGTGAYGYDDGNGGWVESKFTRYFTVESVQTVGNEIQVTVTTEWQAGFLTKGVELTDHFLTWQE